MRTCQRAFGHFRLLRRDFILLSGVAGMYQDEGIVVILMGVVQVHAEDTTDDSHQRHAQCQRCQQQLQLAQAEQGAKSAQV